MGRNTGTVERRGGDGDKTEGLYVRSEISLIVFVCLGEGVDSLGATADDDAAVDGGKRDSPLDVFSVSSADTKDFSLPDGGDASRVALPVTREGIGVRDGGIALKASLCPFPRFCYALMHRPGSKATSFFHQISMTTTELHDIKRKPKRPLFTTPGRAPHWLEAGQGYEQRESYTNHANLPLCGSHFCVHYRDSSSHITDRQGLLTCIVVNIII